MAKISYTMVQSAEDSNYFDIPKATDVPNKVPTAFAISRATQYVLASGVGRCHRTQGNAIPPRQAGDNFVYCSSYRIWNDYDGRRESIPNLVKKGHTHFRCNHYPGEVGLGERDYTPGYRWINYGNQGTNEDPVQYDHRPWRVMCDDWNTIYTNFNGWLKSFNQSPTTSTVDYAIGNFEPFEWNETLYNQCPDQYKDLNFYSYFSNSTTTIRNIFNSGGINALNNHWYAKLLGFYALWCQMVKRRSGNTTLATNGDWIYLQVLNPNGDFQKVDGNVLDIRNYKNFSLSDFTNHNTWAGRSMNCGVQTLGGQSYNLTGHIYDHFDFFNHYNYYSDYTAYMRQSDYNLLTTTTDPNLRTVDAWCDRIFTDRVSPYVVYVTNAVRRHFFNKLYLETGIDYRNKKVFDMWEMMFEINNIKITSDSPNYTNPAVIGDGNPFYPFIAEGSQKILLPKHRVFSRIWQARMLYDGIFEWWEGNTSNTGFTQELNQGKYKYFHFRVAEWAQQALEQIEQFNVAFGSGSTTLYENIPFRWKRNQGTFSDFITTWNPATLAFNKDGNGNWNPLPIIIRRKKGNDVLYFFEVHQAPTDVTYVEYTDPDDGVTRLVKIDGKNPKIQYFNTVLNNTVVTGPYDGSVASTWDTLNPLPSTGGSGTQTTSPTNTTTPSGTQTTSGTTAAPTTLTPAVPSWLNGVGYQYDPATRGFSLFVNRTGTFNVDAKLTQQNAYGDGWVSDNFYTMSTTDAIAPYQLRRNYYPAPGQVGTSGFVTGAINAVIKRNDTGESFSFIFYPVATSGNNVVSIILNSGSNTTTPQTTSSQTTSPVPSGPLPYGFDWQPIAASPRPTNGKVVISNSRMRIERWLNYGGAICHVSEYGGPNLVNNYDWGRQIGVTLYGFPNPFTPPGVQYRPEWLGVGWDPIEAGSTFSTDQNVITSEIIQYGESNGTIYIKSRPVHWHLYNYPSEVIYEVWMKQVAENVVRHYYKITIDRVNAINPDPNYYPAREQELPMIHMPVTHNTVCFYAGQQPWTGQDYSQFSTGNGSQTFAFNSKPLSENWFACKNALGRGYGIYSPNTYTLSVRQYGLYDSGEFGSDCAYMSSMVYRHMDPQGVLYETFDTIIGTPEEVRAWAVSQGRPDPRPDFVYNGTRCNSYALNADVGVPNPNGFMRVTHKNMQPFFFTEARPFKASDVSTLYIRMRNGSPETGLRLAWRKPGQDEVAGQSIDFSVPNDGQFHTVAISVGSVSNWTEMINNVKIEQQYSPENTPTTGRYWDIAYISYINRG